MQIISWGDASKLIYACVDDITESSTNKIILIINFTDPLGFTCGNNPVIYLQIRSGSVCRVTNAAETVFMKISSGATAGPI